MATFTIKNLGFTYPGKKQPAISNINFNVNLGEFIVVCGQTGCGKSTLLRNLKTVLAPHGSKEGEILFYGRPVEIIDDREQASRIGYVFQNPDNQIVTDKVWHELAFGLESLGYDTSVIRLRVAEMANFFGIQNWFLKDVSQLSGGQKQTLNLASVMAMQPDVLILDEPTAQLDPISAKDFLETVKRINQEIGTTVIISEHRLEEVFPMADRVIVMDKGKIISDDIPARTGKKLAENNHPMLMAMPAPVQIYENLVNGGNTKVKGEARDVSPISIRDGRTWLTKVFSDKQISINKIENPDEKPLKNTPAVILDEIWFRYNREGNDVIKGLSLEVQKGQLYCIVGGNGSGKTTALSIIGGINTPYRGKLLINDKTVSRNRTYTVCHKVIMMPQNPQTLFVEDTVFEDLMEMLDSSNLTFKEREEKVYNIAELVEISGLLTSHPYDLSGGEQQRAAFAKVLLTEPEILLLDEPTKGLDNYFKEILADIMKKLVGNGTTIIMVSHDVEFCSKYADMCAMVFDGSIVTTNTPNRFFSGNSFYTTAANRMARHIFDDAVTINDVVTLCKDNLK